MAREACPEHSRAFAMTIAFATTRSFDHLVNMIVYRFGKSDVVVSKYTEKQRGNECQWDPRNKMFIFKLNINSVALAIAAGNAGPILMFVGFIL